MTLSHDDTSEQSQQIEADKITQLAYQMERRLDLAIDRIQSLNGDTKIISINAKMEAARAGGVSGAAFNVVAQSIRDVSLQTSQVAEVLAAESRRVCTELREVNEALSTRVKGERLSDLALMNIDVIDRNLYERSCDCRWWATDASVVRALTDREDAALIHCSRRLGQILDSYTVYFDIVVTDLDGRVLANGRPEKFSSTGRNESRSAWFAAALRTNDGTEFGFESVHRSALVDNEWALAYSCTVREDGNVRGRPLGVLTVLFKWESLAQTVVMKTPLTRREKLNSRACIIEPSGRILADTEGQFLQTLAIPELSGLLRSDKNHTVVDTSEHRLVIGHARAPGFETYSTGWHSIIMLTTAQPAGMGKYSLTSGAEFAAT